MSLKELTTLLEEIGRLFNKRHINEITILPSCALSGSIVSEGDQLGISKSLLKRHALTIYKKAKNFDVQFNKDDSLHNILLALLMFPSVSLFWNKMSHMYTSDLECVKSVLHYMKLVTKLCPKTTEVYLNSFRLLNKISTEHKRILMNDVLKIATIGGERYPNNYLAWTYRQKVVQHYITLGESQDCLLDKELMWIREWREMHVSDYSCFHYSQFIIKLHSNTRLPEELTYEYNDISSLISYYSQHEALHYHKRWVMCTIAAYIKEVDNSHLKSILETEISKCQLLLMNNNSTCQHETRYCQYVTRFIKEKSISKPVTRTESV